MLLVSRSSMVLTATPHQEAMRCSWTGLSWLIGPQIRTSHTIQFHSGNLLKLCSTNFCVHFHHKAINMDQKSGNEIYNTRLLTFMQIFTESS
jgi:hypothetical protein